MFERCLYFNVNALSRTVNRIWEQAFAEFNLSPSHAYLLRLVLSQPGLTPKQISEELKLEKSTVTRFLDALERRDLLQRKKGVSDDARVQGIFPTTTSKKLASRLEARGDELYQKMIGSVGKDKLTRLVKTLREIENAIS